MQIQFTDYDRITDILMYLSNNITLNFNVVLSRKDKTGKRSFFHYETEYPSKCLGVNTGRGIKKDKIETVTIYDEHGESSPEKLSIFHVHGYLPHNKFDDIENPQLIFSEEDYHKVYTDAYCWSNIVQLNYLRENTCLFML